MSPVKLGHYHCGRCVDITEKRALFMGLTMKTNTILVCGDLVRDTHIARLPWTGYGYSQPRSQTQLVNCHAQAWYLRDVILGAQNAAKIDTAHPAPQEATHEEIERGRSVLDREWFSIWKWSGTRLNSAAHERSGITGKAGRSVR